VKRIALAILCLSACRSGAINTAAGASTPQAAVEQMLAGAKAQDLQAVTAVWGDETGLNRDKWDRAQLESRAFIVTCVLKNDTAKITETQSAGNGRFLVSADLTQGKNSASTRFHAARTKEGRWLVADVDIVTLQNKGFCGR
jgi:hypothetical protein